MIKCLNYAMCECSLSGLMMPRNKSSPPFSLSFSLSKVTPSHLSPENGHLVTEEQRADGVVSTLTINKTTTRDFASYNCSVINEYGVDTRQILLQRQREYFRSSVFSHYFHCLLFLCISPLSSSFQFIS